jgi:hypothetical protein
MTHDLDNVAGLHIHRFHSVDLCEMPLGDPEYRQIGQL